MTPNELVDMTEARRDVVERLNRIAVASILFHIEAIAEAVHLPVILQYAPTQTGIDANILGRLPVYIIKVDASPSVPVLGSLPARVTTLVGYMRLDLPNGREAIAVKERYYSRRLFSEAWSEDKPRSDGSTI